MTNLAIAAFLFVGSHFFISSTGVRPMLIAVLGQKAYIIAYSLLSIFLIAGFVAHYISAPYVEIWSPPNWFALIPIAVMLPALGLLVGGVSTPNPTAVMAAAPDSTPLGGVFAVTRHPVMWAIGLWALSHLTANGDGASMILFGSLAFLALAGTLAIDKRKRAAWGEEKWAAFAAATSNLPFQAIAEGRARFSVAECGWRRVGVAVLLYVILVGAHPHVIGVPVWAG